jgi:hypothetical protein
MFSLCTKLNINTIKNLYLTPLPMFMSIGGVCGFAFGLNTIERYAAKKKQNISPVKRFYIIMAGFSMGLAAGAIYPISSIISSYYFINILKELKETDEK